MKKVLIIGNAGGGKSTMARKLSVAQNLPYYAIDEIQWNPGWQQVPKEEYNFKHTNLLSKSKWIIDGFGHWDSIEARFQEADTIIYVDHPIWVHYWWATKRQLKCLFLERPDGPVGCPMLPVTLRLYKMIWDIDKNSKPKILQLIETNKSDKKVIHIGSPKELKSFINSYTTSIGFI